MKVSIENTLKLLKVIGMPETQLNDRTSYVLLTLSGLKLGKPYSQAQIVRLGITDIMTKLSADYQIHYKPNTRETIRKDSVKQLVEAGMLVMNPDKPNRPVNSPQTVYELSAEGLNLIQKYGSRGWVHLIDEFHQSKVSLVTLYAKPRELNLVPVVINDKKVLLSPGKHSELMASVIHDFCPRFTPGAQVLYLGDTGSKLGFFDREIFSLLGLTFDIHGKMPDVVVYDPKREWLILIEVVTSSGPVNGLRYQELKRLFLDSKVGIVYVTALPDRRSLMKYLPEIAWETEVWNAAEPDHLIHFNGERFLGPYN